jgi:hypothetical protein
MYEAWEPVCCCRQSAFESLVRYEAYALVLDTVQFVREYKLYIQPSTCRIDSRLQHASLCYLLIFEDA